MNEGTCKSCGASIIWAVTERGRRMPLSKASERRRFVLEHPTGIARSVVTYESHFFDCPHADEHRSGERIEGPQTLDRARAAAAATAHAPDEQEMKP